MIHSSEICFQSDSSIVCVRTTSFNFTEKIQNKRFDTYLTLLLCYLSEPSTVKKEFTLLQNEEESTAIISQCTQPQEHIVFHKTHKCSSSTIQNILLRYSKNHRSLNHLLLLKRVFPFLVDAPNGTNH